MTNTTEFVLTGLLMGIAGSALIDAWAFLLRRTLHVPTLDYAMLGRWIGHFPRGRFTHARIAAAAPIRAERPIGWLAHYAIGVAFATRQTKALLEAGVPGIHFYVLNRSEAAAAVLRNVDLGG